MLSATISTLSAPWFGGKRTIPLLIIDDDCDENDNAGNDVVDVNIDVVDVDVVIVVGS